MKVYLSLLLVRARRELVENASVKEQAGEARAHFSSRRS